MMRDDALHFYKMQSNDLATREWDELRSLRRLIYGDRLELDLDEIADDSDIDRHSYVFALVSHGSIVATIRLAPATVARMEMRDLKVFPEHLAGDPCVCEITRFAVGGKGLLYGAAIVNGFARWCMANTRLAQWYAYCRPQVARYFSRSFGANIIPDSNFTIAERGIHEYQIVAGTMAECRKLTDRIYSEINLILHSEEK